MEAERVPVLIVGGGLAGLSAAVFLAWHGVPPLLVERRAEVLRHPRARGVNPRTVEVFRQVGLEPELWANRAMGVVATAQANLLLRAPTLASPRYAVEDLAPGEIDGVSPCGWCPIDQDRLETVLRARATELGARVDSGTELRGFSQDPDGVTAILAGPDGTGRTVRTRYLVGADGVHSTVRRLAGIDVEGPGVLLETLTAVFEADLDPVLNGRGIGMAYLAEPREATVIFPHDGVRSWCFGTPLVGDRPYPDEDEVVELIRVAVGVPDLAVTLRAQLPATGRKLLNFPVGAYVAQRFRDRRVLLAGDAARIMPPTGAFGGSTGIQDAHNLAWKLAAVLRGEAGEQLLDTYHTERHAVSRFTVEQAMTRMVSRTGEEGGQVEFPDVVDMHGNPLYPYWTVVFGYRYDSAAVVPDGPADPGPAVAATALSGQPGTRAPHAWLPGTGAATSTLDLFGRSFVLLVPDRDGEWRAATRDVEAGTGHQVTVHAVGTQIGRRYGLESGGAVLVRPDGFVAWRSPVRPSHPAAALAAALDTVLPRPVGFEPASSPVRDADPDRAPVPTGGTS